MPRRCTICDHTDRTDIDHALMHGTAFRHIATQYALSTGALQRHKAEHLPQVLTRAAEDGERLTAIMPALP